jgi:prolyl-tRNA synthetase
MKMSNLLFQNSHFSQVNEGLDLMDLAIKAGFFHKDASGLYSLLTLGTLAQRDIESRLRGAFEGAGACEMRLSLLQDLTLWEKTGRVDAYAGELMTTTSRSGARFALGATAEELVCSVMKDLWQGRSVNQWCWQMGTKWRDELRCRAGLVRAREFSMFDAYSFAGDACVIEARHETAQALILDFFKGLGLSARRVEADCGEIGGLRSEEVQVESVLGETGEDGKNWLEVAHSFVLGDTYSQALGFFDHRKKAVLMGCQGVGLSRTLMAILAERRDERGFWGDEKFAVVDTVITSLNQHKAGVMDKARELYDTLLSKGVRVVWDDREASAGKKLADSELLCARQRIVVSDRALSVDRFEVTNRKTGETKTVEGEAMVSEKDGGWTS